MKQKLLIIGAGREQVPAIERARALGLTVLTTDINPAAPGAALADHFYQASTDDAPGNINIARRAGINGVMTLSSETAVPTVAAVAKDLALPALSPRSAMLATDKLAMKDAFLRHGVPTSPYRRIRDINEAHDFTVEHGFPVVIKPAVNSGQRGTSRVDDYTGLKSAVRKAFAHAPDQRVLIEVFVPGPEINVTAVVEDTQSHLISISERVTAAPPHFGIAVAHAAPAHLGTEDQAALRTAVQRATEAIELRDGIVYPQFIIGPQGPCLLEIAARIPGGFMREVALGVSGIDLIDVAIAQALGEREVLKRTTQHDIVDGLVVRFFTALDADRLKSRPDKQRLAAVAAMPGIQAVHWQLDRADPIPTLAHSGARFAAIIATGENREQAWARAEAASNYLLGGSDSSA
ncbi:MAG TPA: ATP-grasp domain-containing protein [Halothiobacillaceae bacterium]|nr:ATP-grasp domain-containing protein [Halothiobacillaceae bacterium]